MLFLFSFFWFFWGVSWPRSVACGILVPRPGIESAPPALEAQNLNHWTPREVPKEDASVPPHCSLTQQLFRQCVPCNRQSPGCWGMEENKGL